MPHADKLGPLQAAARKKAHAAKRMRLWRDRHPEKVREQNAANRAKNKHQRTYTAKERDRRAERNFRFRGDVNTSIILDSIVSVNDPRLLWIDADGNLHREDLRSAEEVIRDYERENR